MMNNDELLIKIKDMFDTKADEVKRHMEVIAENLESKVQTIAEGHDILNRKIDTLDKKIDGTKKELATRIVNSSMLLNKFIEIHAGIWYNIPVLD